MIAVVTSSRKKFIYYLAQFGEFLTLDQRTVMQGGKVYRWVDTYESTLGLCFSGHTNLVTYSRDGDKVWMD